MSGTPCSSSQRLFSFRRTRCHQRAYACGGRRHRLGRDRAGVGAGELAADRGREGEAGCADQCDPCLRGPAERRAPAGTAEDRGGPGVGEHAAQSRHPRHRPARRSGGHGATGKPAPSRRQPLPGGPTGSKGLAPPHVANPSGEPRMNCELLSCVLCLEVLSLSNGATATSPWRSCPPGRHWPNGPPPPRQ